MQADDRHPRRTFTLQPDVDKILERIHDETGKGYVLIPENVPA